MRITVRRTTVTFTTLFYDEDGEQTIPDDATLTINFPGEGWPMNGDDMETVTVDMVIAVDGTGTYDWDSSVSSPGIIYWHTEAEGSGLASEDGEFRLRGNFANLQFVNA